MVHTGDVTVLARGWAVIGWEVAPDGHAVAVLRYTAADMTRQLFYHDLTTVPLDGNTPTVLARRIPQQHSVTCAWSPDSRALAYVSQGRGHPDQLWVVPSDGSDEPTDLAAGKDLRLSKDEDVPRWSAADEQVSPPPGQGWLLGVCCRRQRPALDRGRYGADEPQQLLCWVQSSLGEWVCWHPKNEVLLQLAQTHPDKASASHRP